MKKFTTFILGFLVCLNISFACINDYSSMHFEQQRFPAEDELIAGKFHIHSKDFYEWRIKDRLQKLKKDPNNPALLDDLAVSYEKTGQTQLAINTLQSVLHKYPNRYETLANLGTFYIHHQEYEKGLQLLKKAIKINPQAKLILRQTKKPKINVVNFFIENFIVVIFLSYLFLLKSKHFY